MITGAAYGSRLTQKSEDCPSIPCLFSVIHIYHHIENGTVVIRHHIFRDWKQGDVWAMRLSNAPSELSRVLS
jgi:hypothetical protein